MSQEIPDELPPELLAAYVDGKLDPARQATVERWLMEHPDVAEELAGHHHLIQVWRATAVPEPSAVTWTAVFERIKHSLATAPSQPGQRRVFARLGWAVGLAAAGLLVALLIVGRSAEEAAKQLAEESFPVAATHEVQILGLDAADTEALVVGVPPSQGPLVLATAGEVRILSIAPDPADQMVAELLLAAPPDVPMIIAPMVPSPEKAP